MNEPTDEEAVRLLGRLLPIPTSSAPELPPPPISTESLGEHLRAWRKRTKHGPATRLALAVGVPRETMQRWEADLELPSADQLHRLCDMLELSPVRALRLVGESARRALRQVLVPQVPKTLAARQRGLAPDENLMLERLPEPLRHGLARRIHSDEPERLAAALADIARLPAAERDIIIDGLAAGLELIDEANG